MCTAQEQHGMFGQMKERHIFQTMVHCDTQDRHVHWIFVLDTTIVPKAVAQWTVLGAGSLWHVTVWCWLMHGVHGVGQEFGLHVAYWVSLQEHDGATGHWRYQIGVLLNLQLWQCQHLRRWVALHTWLFLLWPLHFTVTFYLLGFWFGCRQSG